MLIMGMIVMSFFNIVGWGDFILGVMIYSCIYAILMYKLSLNDYEKDIFRKPILRAYKLVVKKQ